jgi:hypothetical protein
MAREENFIRRGALWGLVASATGSLLFAMKPLFDFPLTLTTFAVQLAIVTALYSIILVAIPAAVGGATLAARLKKDFHKNRLSSPWATAKGMVVGVASVSVIILFVGILMEVMIWSRGRGSIQGFLMFSTEALLIAAIAGGLVGYRLAAYLKRRGNQVK